MALQQVSPTCVPDHVDRRGSGKELRPVQRRGKAGGGGQLPSPQPHRGSDDGCLDTHEDWGLHLLRSTRRAQGEAEGSLGRVGGSVKPSIQGFFLYLTLQHRGSGNGWPHSFSLCLYPRQGIPIWLCRLYTEPPKTKM